MNIAARFVVSENLVALPTLCVFFTQLRDRVTSRQSIINRAICCLRRG